MNYLIYKFNNMISNSMNNMDNMNNMNIVDNVLLSKYKNIKQQQELEDIKSKKCEKGDIKIVKHTNKFIYNGNLEDKVDNDESCVICFNDFSLTDNIAACPSCKNILHMTCMKKWLNMGKHTCIFCRNTVWKDLKKEERKVTHPSSSNYNSYTNLE